MAITKYQGKRGVTYKVVVDVPSPEGKRRQKKVTCKTRKEAERVERELKTQIEKGIYADAGKWTVADYLRHWLGTYGRPNLAPRTFERYQEVINLHLIPALGVIPLAKLTPAHVQGYYSQALASGRRDRKRKVRGDGLSPTTVLQHHRILHKALESAVKWQLVPRNVCDAVDPPRKVRREMAILTEEQARRLLDSLQGHYLHLPTLLALTTGMRLGEVLGLRWQDVDFDTCSLYVRQALLKVKDGQPTFAEPKTAKSRRRIEVDPALMRALREHRKQQAAQRLAAGEAWQDWGLVCTHRDGRPVNPATVSREFTERARKLGLPVRFHDLRHTAASFMLKAGVNPKVVAEILGHSTTVLTLDTYSHLLPGMQREAAGKLARMVLGGATNVTKL